MRKLLFLAIVLLSSLYTSSYGESYIDLKTAVLKESQALLIDQFGSKMPSKTKKIDFYIPWNQPGVQFWLQYYNSRVNRLKLIQSVSRYSMFIPYIKPIIQREKLPEILLYLPIVESNGDPSARSKAGAAGLWQLMPRTARMYGLKVNRYIDERYDIEKSTKAAVRYLKDLYRMFGKWELAIAAYNAGPGKIRSLMKRYRAKTFWDLAKLPDETLNYVPKFYAVAYLLSSNKIHTPKNNQLVKIKIMSKASLYSIARKLKVPYSIIKTYNKQYRRRVVPARHYVYIPMFAIKNRTLLSKAENAKIYIYRPYKTEKVTRIAKKFGTDAKTLKIINRIKGKYVYKGQVLLIVAYNSSKDGVALR